MCSARVRPRHCRAAAAGVRNAEWGTLSPCSWRRRCLDVFSVPQVHRVPIFPHGGAVLALEFVCQALCVLYVACVYVCAALDTVTTCACACDTVLLQLVFVRV